MSEAVEVIVDLREQLPKIRDQGIRPLCLAFAGSDLNAFNNNLVSHLSVEYLAFHAYQLMNTYKIDQGLSIPSVIQVLKENGQILEALLPYDESRAKLISPPQSKTEVFKTVSIEDRCTSDLVISALDNKKIILLGLSLTSSFFDPTSPYVLDYETGEQGLHAVTAVGYGVYQNEKVILIRNSWGESWAEEGYAWLTAKYINNRTLTSIQLIGNS
ncbi:MAG: C1 family peptidase [Kangiellaceae bacterium]|nr:C1 family peptidase [Kangiellaceae bacterium]MCW8997359.1 C1 family peptidase [Kangiellaceae bacterium]